MDIIEIISQYLHDNRRLVVPSFGAFIVKSPDEILFSQLLKTDDGVLRSLLVATGLSELAAAGEIDRFIFEAREALSDTGRFALDSLGVLVAGKDGTLRLEQPHKPASVATETRLRRKASELEQPHKPASVATAPVRPSSESANARVPQPHADRQQVRPRGKRRGADWFMVIAVFVLLCAIAAIGYGWFCSTLQGEQDDAMMDELRYKLEQPVTPNK